MARFSVGISDISVSSPIVVEAHSYVAALRLAFKQQQGSSDIDFFEVEDALLSNVYVQGTRDVKYYVAGLAGQTCALVVSLAVHDTDFYMDAYSTVAQASASMLWMCARAVDADDTLRLPVQIGDKRVGDQAVQAMRSYLTKHNIPCDVKSDSVWIVTPEFPVSMQYKVFANVSLYRVYVIHAVLNKSEFDSGRFTNVKFDMSVMPYTEKPSNFFLSKIAEHLKMSEANVRALAQSDTNYLSEDGALIEQGSELHIWELYTSTGVLA